MLKDIIMAHVGESTTGRYTPQHLVRAVAAARNVSPRDVRKAIRALVSGNRLVYTHHLGHTFLEISYRRPVDVGAGIILTPPGMDVRPAPGETMVRIAPGAAFGMGDHPTTRIALRIMAWAVKNRRYPGEPAASHAIDIGTGTGVLAIAACLMGIGHAVAIDTDPCARAEAAENVRLNKMEKRVRVVNTGLETLANEIQTPFSLVLANLRHPTLAALSEKLPEMCDSRAVFVFSGFKEQELESLLASYPPARFEQLLTMSENQWCGVLLQQIA